MASYFEKDRAHFLREIIDPCNKLHQTSLLSGKAKHILRPFGDEPESA